MTDQPTGALPAKFEALVVAATSEAKRRGHDRVTPAHVAVILNVATGDPATQFDDATTASIAAYLDSLPRTFGSPTVDSTTLDMLQSCVAAESPLTALADSLREQARDLKPDTPPDMTRGESPEEVSSTPGAFALPEHLRGVAEIVDATEPVVPRADTVRRVLSLITARDPQTPLVVAREGHGRSSLARCLAARLAEPDYAGPLAGWRVVRVRPEAVIAADRFRTVQQILHACRGSAVVFIDDVEVLCGLGSGGGGDYGMLLTLRSTLHDRDLRVVLTVATEFVDRFQSADIELFAELDRVDMPSLSDEEILDIARAEAELLAAHHGVEIGPDVVAAAAAPPRQIDNQGHPALAVARLDRAAAAAALGSNRIADAADLGTAVAGQQYLTFDPDAATERLKLVVLGQDAALDKVTNRLALTRASLDARPERPDGVFLFAGPTGTGKTELALSLAREVFGTDEALIRLDMSEFAEDHTVSKLIGSPPGYVGSTEPESWLTTKIRRRPQSVLLLDEIEKAHPQIWNTFLQVFDAGRLTDSQGRVAEFCDTIVVLTTNIGAAAFADRNAAGFMPSAENVGHDEREVRDELKRWMRPELLNRFDDILVFRPLSPDTVRSIVAKQLGDAVKRLGDRGWVVEMDEPAVIDVLSRKGYSKEYGARPLIRALEENLLGRIGRLPIGPVRVSVEGDELVVVAPEVASAD